MANMSPTLRQRQLGARLRHLRNEFGLTVEDVGDKLLCSPTKISRLETGARKPALRDVRDLCALYGVDEAETAELMSLAREAREPSWWMEYGDLNLNPYIGLEETAVSIVSYSMYYVPALLQTKDYAQAIIGAIARKIDPEVQQQRVDARMRRQLRLEQPGRPNYRVIIDEAVLHRRIGGTAVMASQLAKILEAERDGKATVQVIPFDAGGHAAQDSNFILFEFADDKESDDATGPVVFVEGLIKHQYQERKGDVERYREAIEYLRDAALSPRDTIRLIREMQRAYAKG